MTNGEGAATVARPTGGGGDRGGGGSGTSGQVGVQVKASV